MNNVILNVFLSMKNKLNFMKSSNFFTLLYQSTIFILLLLSLNSFAQPPIDITKEKAKQPPIIQPQQPVKEPKSQPIPAKTNPAPVKTFLVTQPPRQTLPQGIKEITIFPFEDNTKINFQYTGSIEIESLGDTAIVGIQLLPNTEYKLQVRVEKYIHPQYKIEVERFVLYKQIKPAPVTVNNIPEIIPGNNGKELYVYELPNGKVIQTNNTILFIDQWIEDDGSISIKLLGENNFRRFYNNIYRFTFYEGATYILEVIKEGNDFILMNVLSETPTSVSKPAIKQYPAIPPHIINRILTEEAIKDSKITAEPVYEVEEITDATATNYYPVFNATSLDSAIWRLRYLFQTDSLIPINDLTGTSYSITTDISLDKINIKTPCGSYDDKLRSYQKNKFIYESRTISFKKCDSSTELLFEQLKNVNHYEIIDNKLKLSINKPEFSEPKVLIVFEGFAIK